MAAALVLAGCGDSGEAGFDDMSMAGSGATANSAGSSGSGGSGSGGASGGSSSGGGSKASGGTGGSGNQAGSSSGGGAGNGDARIRVQGNKLRLCGQDLFINGANTPWNSWNDFGGAYDASFWSEHFGALHDAGVNASRVWITCSGEVGIQIADNGTVSGATDQHWADLDDYFAVAQSKGVYVMATLMSFDHFKSGAAARWHAMIQSDQAIESYVTSYVVPFVERYGKNPYLWSIDLMNEPDWAFEEQSVPWERLRAYFARAAAAIHEHSEVLVTVGLAMPKYQSDCAACEGNQISDAALEAIAPGAALDFYSPHHYDWITEIWGDPLAVAPAAYGYDVSKPYMLGELPAHGTAGHTLTEDLARSFANGYVGLMPWTSNGVDANGGFEEVSAAAKAFVADHAAQVFPACP